MPGRVLLAVGRAPVDASLVAAAATKAANTAGAAAALSLSEPLSLEASVQLLRDAPFPQTPVLFRDMEQYLALRALASTPGP
jgi:hypothetical protein